MSQNTHWDITCPSCSHTNTVYQLDWTAITCLTCKGEILAGHEGPPILDEEPDFDLATLEVHEQHPEFEVHCGPCGAAIPRGETFFTNLAGMVICLACGKESF